MTGKIVRVTLRVLKWLGLTIAGLVAVVVVSNCTMLGLNYASLETDNRPAASPPIVASSVAEWEAQKPGLLEAFEENVYGPWPEGLSVTVGETRVAEADFLDGRAVLEETSITLGSGEGARTFRVAIAWPKDASGPVPVVIGQTFGPTCYVFASLELSNGDGSRCTETDMTGMTGMLVKGIFGEYIAYVPTEQFIARGYAYASFYASEVIPDNGRYAGPAMAALRESDGVEANGAIAYWSYGYSAIMDYLESDGRADMDRIAVWGHSRHGKSALVAAAYDPRIDLVFSHQSGFGGAALSRSEVGEGLDGITQGGKFLFFMDLPGYPYWFAPKYSEFAGNLDAIPVDQHQLIALIAPRPVMIGNGRRDVWSDPNSTYRATEAAAKVYELYAPGSADMEGMRDLDVTDLLVYYLRSGGHGIVKRDIDVFLSFLDAHFKTGEGDAVTAR